ncbi:hypothetical protein [Cellulomonas sp. Leaf334]|uniref:hypothetical protein n=1 Tax=Cellulomonas sp. Leaf334 TaxID=1736339 RepID=UPI0006FD7916|nr:hypothetical protein [Cellulomonas sp. Leaf334]KQR07679.1 hypothetical protein ASF78_20600 [Cellulomonas sp. Leaf334]
MATETNEAISVEHTGVPPARVLELRVHGVSNTPPASMLAVEKKDVCRSGGDDLSGFWTLSRDAEAKYLRPDGTASGPAHSLVPEGVRREAYSWGGLARSARKVPGVDRVPGVARGVIRAFWVFIIPFGMVNVAHWARDLHEPERGGRRVLRTGSGGLVRLAGLTVTLLWVVTAATVTLGLVAAQCFVPDSNGTTVVACSILPDPLNGLADWSSGQRTALFAALAAAAFLVLGGVATTGIVRYERVVSPTRAKEKQDKDRPRIMPDVKGAATSWPWLARTGFWDHVRASTSMWLDHLAAGFALIAILVSWQMLHRAGDQCPSVGNYLLAECRDLSGTPDAGKSWFLLLVLGWALLAVVAVRIGFLQVEPGSTSKDPRWVIDAGLLAVAVAVLVWVEIETATSVERPVAVGDPARFAGLEVVPAVLIATLVLLCVAAVGLRGHLPAIVWAPLVVAGIGAAVMTLVERDAQDADGVRLWATVATGVLVVLGVVAFAANLRADGRENEGWGGRGPAVFLALASGFGMVLSGAMVAGVVGWLELSTVPAGVSRSTAESVEAAGAWPEPVVSSPDGSLNLWTPEGYREFAAMSLLVIVALAAAVVVLGLRTWLFRTTIRDLPFDTTPSTVGSAAGMEKKIAGTRRLATLAHRAERIVGWLAASFWFALVATLLARPAGASESSAAVPSMFSLAPRLDDWGTKSVLFAVGLLVASVVVAGSKKSLVRPWGLLWDLMCFLPRVAHPFGPPCYAERAVPELRGRIDEWLGAADAQPDSGRRVVMSAHSLGAVVVVAALLARWDTRTATTESENIAFLSFGTQLRSYFGRFFPELLGPTVLGTRPTRGAKAWAGDPWSRETKDAEVPPFAAWTLVGSLTPEDEDRTVTRWRSLWRRTDYLGFPVNGYAVGADESVASTEIDRMDAEWDESVDPAKVATHGGDQRTPQYRTQLTLLVGLLPPRRAAQKVTPDGDDTGSPRPGTTAVVPE